MHAGFYDERATVGKSSFPSTKRVLDEHARREVAVICPQRAPRLSLHRETACAWFTIGILDHKRDG
jgi:hypothetical protein